MARLFERLLEQHEHMRHRSLLSGGRERTPPPRPDPYEGFMPPAKAAAEMDVTVEELVDMARGGILEWREFGGEVYVRPAVVTRLAVREAS